MMMMVSSSSVFVNRLRRSAVSRPKGGRSSGSGFLAIGVEKATAYKAPGAAIEGVPATWVSPEIDLMSALSVMAASSRRRRQGFGQGAEVHFVGRGVAEGFVYAPLVVERKVFGQGLARLRAVGVRP